MRVLQFIDSFAVAGSETVAKTLALGLRRFGHESHVCAVSRGGPMGAELEGEGVGTSSLDAPEGRGGWLMRRFWGAIRSFGADAVITHHFRQLAHAVLPARAAGCTLLHVEHDFHFYQRYPRLLGRLSLALLGADALVAVSSEVGRLYADCGRRLRRKLVVIENGVDSRRFAPDPEGRARARELLGIPADTVVVGTVARLEPPKNLELLLRAFQLLCQEVPEARLVLVGDGSERARLEALAGEVGIRDRTAFCGVSAGVPALLNAFDVYATTSVKEGLPLSVLEAMACGLPVVATPVGELPSLVTPDVGCLAAGFTPEAVAEPLKRLALAPGVRRALGLRGRETVVRGYSSDAMVAKYAALLDSRRDARGAEPVEGAARVDGGSR